MMVWGVQDLRSGGADRPFYGVVGLVGAALALLLGVMVLAGFRRVPR